MKARKPVVLLEIFYTDQTYFNGYNQRINMYKIEPNSLSQTGTIHRMKS